METSLVVAFSGLSRPGVHQRTPQFQDDRSRNLNPSIEVDGGNNRLHGVGKDRGLFPAPGGFLSPPERQVRSEIEAQRQSGEFITVHAGRPHLGHRPLAQVRKGRIKVICYDQLQDRIAQKLHPFVVIARRTFGSERTMQQGVFKERLVGEGVPESCLKVFPHYESDPS